MIAVSCALDNSLSLTVPHSAAPDLDGIIAKGEWAGALRISVSEGDTLLFLYNNGYLYAGIRSTTPFLGSICILRSGKIMVLHSSAALRTIMIPPLNYASVRDAHCQNPLGSKVIEVTRI